MARVLENEERDAREWVNFDAVDAVRKTKGGAGLRSETMQILDPEPCFAAGDGFARWRRCGSRDRIFSARGAKKFEVPQMFGTILALAGAP